MTSKSITIPRQVVLVLLASLYSLGFIVTPYWRSARSTSEMMLILAVTILAGATWIVFAGDDLRIKIGPVRWGFLPLLFVISILLNFKPLTSVIPWRGDEDYHIQNTLWLASTISTKWLLVLFAAFLLLVYLAWRRTRWIMPIGILFLLGMIFFIGVENPFADLRRFILFRYPYINYWFFALFPKLALILRLDPHHEVLFRIIPFVASLALIGACQVYFARPERPLDLLWGFAIATLPLVYYYSSILYLELPAIFLMTLVCMNIGNLLYDDFPTLKQNPFWYALILTGFIKETTVLFLLCFIGWRLLAFLLKRRTTSVQAESFGQGLIQEVKVALAIFLPALLYLFLRTFQTQNRNLAPDIMNLVNPEVLHAVGQSLVDQIGLFLILALAGSIVLLLKKEYLVFGFLASLFLFYQFFYVLDRTGYAGYSRFNLHLLPPVLAISGAAIRELTDKKRLFSLILAGVIIGANLWMSPIHWDGAKKPFWGSYLADISEHYYPYQEALEWLKATHRDDRILFTGMRYPYLSFPFYFSKLDWEPKHEIVLTEKTEDQAASISDALAQAEAAGFDVVLYQITGNEVPPIADSHNFAQEKIFKNDAHMLVVYYRTQR